jgi:hypothetical protein
MSGKGGNQESFSDDLGGEAHAIVKRNIILHDHGKDKFAF